MEKVLKTETEHLNSWVTNIEIDNSTEFKDFHVKIAPLKNPTKSNTKEQTLQLSKSGFKTANLTLEIGGVTLVGREVELLREFLNQNLDAK